VRAQHVLSRGAGGFEIIAEVSGCGNFTASFDTQLLKGNEKSPPKRQPHFTNRRFCGQAPSTALKYPAAFSAGR